MIGNHFIYIINLKHEVTEEKDKWSDDYERFWESQLLTHQGKMHQCVTLNTVTVLPWIKGQTLGTNFINKTVKIMRKSYVNLKTGMIKEKNLKMSIWWKQKLLL